MNLRRIALAALTAAVALPALADECDVDDGKKVFRKCRACHMVGENAKNRVGPVLNGVVNNEIASAEDFKYSDAFLEKKNEGLVWTPDALHQFLTNPRDYIPGTKMTFAGLRDEEDRNNVVCYLETLEK